MIKKLENNKRWLQYFFYLIESNIGQDKIFLWFLKKLSLVVQ